MFGKEKQGSAVGAFFLFALCVAHFLPNVEHSFAFRVVLFLSYFESFASGVSLFLPDAEHSSAFVVVKVLRDSKSKCVFSVGRNYFLPEAPVCSCEDNTRHRDLSACLNISTRCLLSDCAHPIVVYDLQSAIDRCWLSDCAHQAFSTHSFTIAGLNTSP